MTTRTAAPLGAPCWADLWTPDVEGSRTFYAGLFGWEALEPSPEFGGYFMFARNGVPVAGGMGDMGDMPADNRWKVYLCVSDAAGTLQLAQKAGAQVHAPAMAVADLGVQAVLADPTGAPLGVWQPGTFPGFSVLDEHGTPSWFELRTGDFRTAVEFYRSVFGWDARPLPGTSGFDYVTLHDADADRELAGIMDATSFLASGDPGGWSIYWQVDDIDASATAVVALGGTVLDGPTDTPFGRIATVTDPAGAPFKLRS